MPTVRCGKRPVCPRRVLPLIALLTLCSSLALLAGCGATIQPRPFARFSTAIQETRDGMDEVMATATDWSRQAFIDDLSADSGLTPNLLMLEFDDDYGYSLEAQPIYFEFQKTRTALYGLNAALAEYAELLRAFSDEELMTADRFDMMSGELNDNVNEILGATRADADVRDVALFSMASSELFRGYLADRKAESLRAALEENQTAFAAVTGRCINLIEIVRAKLVDAYRRRYDAIFSDWEGAKPSKRKKMVRDAVNLNDACIAALRALEALEQSYATMPTAHADLAGAIDGQATDLTATQELFATAARLKRLYGELKTSGAAIQGAE